MVSLTMMARLLEALRPETRLVLVGDPDQLASIEAGAVLADLVEGLVAGGHVEGRRAAHLPPVRQRDRRPRARRSAKTGADDTLALLRGSGERVDFVEDADPRDALRSVLLPDALAIRTAAEAGDDDRRAGGARPAPAALRAPGGAPRRRPLEPHRRALDHRGDRGPALGHLVRRPAGAGDRQRLRLRHLQRRRRRDAPAPGRLACASASTATAAASTSPPAGSATSRPCTR